MIFVLQNAVFQYCPKAKNLFNRFSEQIDLNDRLFKHILLALRDYFLTVLVPKRDQLFSGENTKLQYSEF